MSSGWPREAHRTEIGRAFDRGAFSRVAAVGLVAAIASCGSGTRPLRGDAGLSKAIKGDAALQPPGDHGRDAGPGDGAAADLWQPAGTDGPVGIDVSPRGEPGLRDADGTATDLGARDTGGETRVDSGRDSSIAVDATRDAVGGVDVPSGLDANRDLPAPEVSPPSPTWDSPTALWDQARWN